MLQKDVREAIKWEPLLHAAEIGVTAKDGFITLTGVVNSYAKKIEAEDAAKNVAGVKVVVEKLTIELGGQVSKSDAAIATEVVNAFRWNWEVPEDKVHVTVEGGWLTLTGEVEWNYQKEAAQRAVKNLAGVKGVTNAITIKTTLHDAVDTPGGPRQVRKWPGQHAHQSLVGSIGSRCRRCQNRPGYPAALFGRNLLVSGGGTQSLHHLATCGRLPRPGYHDL